MSSPLLKKLLPVLIGSVAAGIALQTTYLFEQKLKTLTTTGKGELVEDRKLDPKEWKSILITSAKVEAAHASIDTAEINSAFVGAMKKTAAAQQSTNKEGATSGDKSLPMPMPPPPDATLESFQRLRVDAVLSGGAILNGAFFEWGTWPSNPMYRLMRDAMGLPRLEKIDKDDVRIKKKTY